MVTRLRSAFLAADVHSSSRALAWLISASIVRLFSRRPLGIEQPRNRAIARKLRSLAIA
jgi:hypothetical protein